jgi:hypothetical protein
LRSIDIWLTRSETLRASQELASLGNLDNEMTRITASDVMSSIMSLPCPCPPFPHCWKLIKKQSLFFVVVSVQDALLLSRLGIQSITELSNISDIEQLEMERIEYAIKDLLYGRNDTSLNQNQRVSFILNLAKKKIGIWRISSSEIVIPIMDMFGDELPSGTGAVISHR